MGVEWKPRDSDLFLHLANNSIPQHTALHRQDYCLLTYHSPCLKKMIRKTTPDSPTSLTRHLHGFTVPRQESLPIFYPLLSEVVGRSYVFRKPTSQDDRKNQDRRIAITPRSPPIIPKVVHTHRLHLNKEIIPSEFCENVPQRIQICVVFACCPGAACQCERWSTGACR